MSGRDMTIVEITLTCFAQSRMGWHYWELTTFYTNKIATQFEQSIPILRPVKIPGVLPASSFHLQTIKRMWKTNLLYELYSTIRTVVEPLLFRKPIPYWVRKKKKTTLLLLHHHLWDPDSVGQGLRPLHPCRGGSSGLRF